MTKIGRVRWKMIKSPPQWPTRFRPLISAGLSWIEALPAIVKRVLRRARRLHFPPATSLKFFLASSHFVSVLARMQAVLGFDPKDVLAVAGKNTGLRQSRVDSSHLDLNSVLTLG